MDLFLVVFVLFAVDARARVFSINTWRPIENRRPAACLPGRRGTGK